jgi:hypothetical protein
MTVSLARRVARLVLSVTVAAGIASQALPARAALLFSEPFQYTVGANLAGQNGGSGFSGVWGSGSSTIVAGLNGGGSAVAIDSTGGAQTRQLSSTLGTTGTASYISYLMNSSDFNNGNYTGIDLVLGPSTSQLFLGIPFNARKFGFDAKNSLPIQTINFTPTTNTSYLVAIGLIPSTTPGKVDIKMWATSNLAIDPTTLVASTPNAQLIGTRNNFTFDRILLDGNMPSSLKVSGLATSPSISEAVAVSVAAVPEPGSAALTAIGCAAAAGWRAVRRRRHQS